MQKNKERRMKMGDVSIRKKGMNQKTNKGAKIALLVFVGIFIAVFLVLLIQNVHYHSRWYKHTTVNGVDVSGMTLEETAALFEQQSKDYALTIKARQDDTLKIASDDIALTFSLGDRLQEEFQKQHKKIVVFHKKHQYDVLFDISFDEDRLEDVLEPIIEGSDEYSIQKPQSAYVQYDKEKNQYVKVPEEPGNVLNEDAFLEGVSTVVKELKKEWDISSMDVTSPYYEAPKYTVDSPEVEEELSIANQAVIRFIKWDIGDDITEEIAPKTIAGWVTVKNGKVSYDEDKIEKWVTKTCLKYKTVGKSRKVKVHTGKTVTIHGGDYGWQIDYEKMLKQTKKALKKSVSKEAVEAYIADASKTNKKAITIKKKAEYLNTAFQRSEGEDTVDWDTENYTEISLKDQMVYVFRKGKVVYKCKCITGKPVADRKTRTGAYFIKEHRTQYTLTGADYSTPVQNWVRITWTGTGFHPATWQNWSRWTKDTYKTRGSHGCINLEPSAAKKIYDLTKYREACFIY